MSLATFIRTKWAAFVEIINRPPDPLFYANQIMAQMNYSELNNVTQVVPMLGDKRAQVVFLTAIEKAIEEGGVFQASAVYDRPDNQPPYMQVNRIKPLGDPYDQEDRRRRNRYAHHYN